MMKTEFADKYITLGLKIAYYRKKAVWGNPNRLLFFAERQRILSSSEIDEFLLLYLCKTAKIKIFCVCLLLFTLYMV